MPLQIASLNSGSNGNCYYVGNDDMAVLIDAGISCRETERRMKQLQLDIMKVKAIFISHEHADHIAGMAVLSKKYQLPVYITPDTLRKCPPKIERHLIHTFSEKENICLGNLSIIPFSKSHDAHDPHSFVVSNGKINIGVFTDIGHACKNIIAHFRACHAVFLEANYDEAMLENGAYPRVLKKRIAGQKGHLSNRQALELFCQHKWEGLQLLILSHLSKENNTPEIVEKLFLKHAGATGIFVASREQASPVFQIMPGKLRQMNKQMIQMRMFEE